MSSGAISSTGWPLGELLSAGFREKAGPHERLSNVRHGGVEERFMFAACFANIAWKIDHEKRYPFHDSLATCQHVEHNRSLTEMD